jgi:hypothetical protein
VLLLALVLSACAGPRERLADVPDLATADGVIELADTPFFPQEALQCGPAALATLLGASGLAATPAALTPEVYTPELGGSLQPEMLGAIRRRGLLAYELPPTLPAVTAELVAGRPVLVLQNLGLRSRPVWHYAVLIGVDPVREQWLLRSGGTRRLSLSTDRFLTSWDRAGRWAVITLMPGELPARPARDRYHRAATGLEAAGHPAGAARAWHAALETWPDDETALFGLGNALFAGGDLAGARDAWERYLARNPDDVAGRNNLAVLLGRMGCRDRALSLASAALADLTSDALLYREVLDTVRSLEAMPPGAEAAGCRARAAADGD